MLPPPSELPTQTDAPQQAILAHANLLYQALKGSQGLTQGMLVFIVEVRESGLP